MKILDKEEFRVKLEEINHLVEQKDYKGAMNVVDSIDWRRVKNVRTLCVVGEIYAANKRYEDSKEIFLLAYHRASIGKNILYRLVEVSLKMGDVSDAVEYYEEYREVAPNDNTQYILKYKILREKKAPLAEQIKVLEDYKEKEFTEKWSYELAKLYYQDGDKEKCLELCNEIILWFNEGSYVMKAMDLKQRMGALKGEEKERYEQQFVPKLLKPEDVDSIKVEAEEKSAEPQTKSGEQEIESIQIKSEELDEVESLQDKISKGLRDIFGSRKMEETEDSMASSVTSEEVQEEMLRDPATEKEYASVPELEPETGKVKEEKKVEVEENPAEQDSEADADSSADEAAEGESVEEPETTEDTEEAVEEVAEAETDAEETAEESVEAEQDTTETEEESQEAAPLKMPTLNIPESMKNMELSKPPKVEEVAETKLNMDSFDLEGKELNLEDTILAAASAQGIEIPKEEESKTEEVQEESSETDVDDKEIKAHDISEELEEPDFLSGDIQDIKVADPKPDEEPKKEIPVQPEIEEAEEEDEVTEEDLRRAEEEFLHGPMGNTDLNPEDDTEGTEEAQPLTEEEELERFIESIQPENGADPRDIVPREKELTDDEKQLFTYFVKVPGMKEQLVDTLYDVQMAAADKTSKTGNIIVMGGKECGKTRLISGLIPAICKELNLEASKVAYVFADQINGKNIYKIFSKLAGGFLVIENANQLTPETVEMLDKAMEVNTDGLTVIVEDEKIGMRKLIARYPKFAKKFTSMINIPVFTNDELVNFARVYTKENGYAIDQMGMLALYNLIGINQKEDSPMNVGAVKELIDAAIAKSQGGIRKFKRNVSKKRIDRDGYIVLYEKDFTK